MYRRSHLQCCRELKSRLLLQWSCKTQQSFAIWLKTAKHLYQFIEIMACPGGCINGGGQPVQKDATRNTVDIKGLRAKALYDLDASMELRKSHESPVIKMLL